MRIDKKASQLTTNCSQPKMQSADGQFYLTDVADHIRTFRMTSNCND
ncbi:MAG: hypothetical protein IPO85_10650 [Saprospiraceae bacterium]|uniref:Uncharacterized protein n=1 Tax=Candidatus Defluviibacterium haderslevense TaxID=2981993 RepID=A0A9D7XHM3_9BACT|nr:hypothetical protein [Candidatus Defluviibacterium haderslevense]